MSEKVWVVLSGCFTDPGTILSVHATEESARGFADDLADERGLDGVRGTYLWYSGRASCPDRWLVLEDHEVRP